MAVLGGCCFLYYLILRMVMKKWNSTFAGFWLASGVICMVFHLIVLEYPEIVEDMPWEWLLIPAAIFLIIEGLVFCGMSSSKERELPYIIVLGAQIQGKTVTEALKRRLERAIVYLEKHSEAQVIVAGGQGKGEETTEAEAMEKYLVERGIQKSRIMCENRSTTTRENFLFSAEYIPDKKNPVGIVTNNFHMYRAVCLAKRAGFRNTYRLSAGCRRVLFLNYAVREFFAVLKMWLVR